MARVKFANTIIMVLAVLAVAAVPAAKAATEMDPGGQSEDETFGAPEDDPNNEFDAYTCLGVPEEREPEIPGITDDPFSLDGFSMMWNWGLDTMKQYFRGMLDTYGTRPSVDIIVTPPAPRDGEEMRMMLQAEGFRTGEERLYKSLFYGEDETDLVWMNPLVAGGISPASSGKWRDGSLETKACQAIARDPAAEEDTDTDLDGMGDNWEMVNFAGKLNPLTGTNYPTDQVALLAAVKPDEDPDADGYRASRFRAACKNGLDLWENPLERESVIYSGNEAASRGRTQVTTSQQDRYLSPAPPIYIPSSAANVPNNDPDGTGPIDPTGLFLIIGSSDDKLGLDDGIDWTDAALPNVMEYVLGLNPLSPDTDGDGVMDGEDLMGVNRPAAELIAEGLPYQERLAVAMAIGNTEKEEVKQITALKKRIFLGGGGESLKVSLRSNRESLRADQPTEFNAEPLTDASTAAIMYRWFVVDESGNKNYVCRTAADDPYEDRCGLGKSTWELPPIDSLEPGKVYEVGVEATNTLNGRTTTKTMKMFAGENTQYAIKTVDPESDEAGDSLCTWPNASADLGTVIPPCAVPGEVVQIEAQLGSAVADETQEARNEFLQRTVAEWSIDDQVVQKSAGLEATGGIDIDTCTPTLVGCHYHDIYRLAVDRIIGNDYQIKARFLDRETGQARLEFEFRLPVVAPFVTIQGCGDATARYCSVQSGETLNFSYVLSNGYTIAEPDEDLSVSWTVDGVETSKLNLMSYVFDGDPGAEYAVGLRVGGILRYGGEDLAEQIFKTSDLAIVTVAAEDAAATGWTGRMGTLAAAVSEAAGDLVPKAIQYMAIAAIVFTGLFMFMRLESKGKI